LRRRIEMPKIYKEDLARVQVSFSYPRRKADMLIKLYGGRYKEMIALVADKLIADASNDQLSLALEMEGVPRYRTSTLMPLEIDEIKGFIAEGIEPKKIAQRYGVSRTTISYIKNGKYNKYK
jgi:hypothetical protein